MALITIFTRRRRDRPLLIAAVVAGVLVVLQALLGGQVVIQQLRAELVVAHLAMALTVLALTIVIADRAASGDLPRPSAGLPGTLVAVTGAAVFAQMLLGSWVTGSGAGLAFADFPLMRGSLWPSISSGGDAISLAHRLLAVAVGLLVLWIALRIRRSGPGPMRRRVRPRLTAWKSE